MYAVQTIDTRGQWVTGRKFWSWADANDHAYYLRRDGYEARVIAA